MKTKQLIFSLFTALLLSATIFSCSDSDKGTGTMNVRMTDAPYPTDDIEEANITISKIEVRQEGSANVNGNPFMTIFEGEASANLLDLTNGVTQNITSVEIPVGTYDLIRVYISEASIKLKDGTILDLTVPSGAASGLKVFVEPGIEVAGGLTAELLLDIDVASSFIPQGPIDALTGFKFVPVIKASNESFAGRFVGSVSTIDGEDTVGIEGATVIIYANGEKYTTTFTDVNGEYAAIGVDAGMYDISVEAEGYAQADSSNLEIVAANATTVDFILEAEAAE